MKYFFLFNLVLEYLKRENFLIRYNHSVMCGVDGGNSIAQLVTQTGKKQMTFY